MKRRLRRRGGTDTALDITPFLNLMVILVPFLLVTAVFSRLAVLDLGLPQAGEAKAAPQAPLRVTLAADGTLTVRGGGLGRHRLVPRAGRPDLAALRGLLLQAKAARPESRAVTLAIADGQDYGTVVALMDAVRRLPRPEGAAELFPDIALATLEGRP